MSDARVTDATAHVMLVAASMGLPHSPNGEAGGVHHYDWAAPERCSAALAV